MTAKDIAATLGRKTRKVWPCQALYESKNLMSSTTPFPYRCALCQYIHSVNNTFTASVMLEFAESIFISLLKSPQKHASLNAVKYLNIKYMLMYLFQNWRKIHLPSFEKKKPLQSQGLPEYLEKWCVACHSYLHKAPLRIAFIWGVSQNLALDSLNTVKPPFCQHWPLWAQFSGLSAICKHKRRTGWRQGNMKVRSITQQWK